MLSKIWRIATVHQPIHASIPPCLLPAFFPCRPACHITLLLNHVNSVQFIALLFTKRTSKKKMDQKFIVSLTSFFLSFFLSSFLPVYFTPLQFLGVLSRAQAQAQSRLFFFPRFKLIIVEACLFLESNTKFLRFNLFALYVYITL